MADIPRSHLLAYALCALVVLVVGVRHVGQSRAAAEPVPPPGGATIAVDGAPGDGAGATGGRLVVHVAGAVRQPGVYRLPAGARVDDAVRRAGGVRRRADLTQLNLAAEVEDGRQVLVPVRPPKGGTAAPSAGGTATAAGMPLNLNTATLEQLDTLQGVGPATAQAILDYREEHGGFSDVEELGEVPGIGDVRLASLRDQVRV